MKGQRFLKNLNPSLSEDRNIGEPITADDSVRQFRLSGALEKHDLRVTPIRGDLADIKLAGKFFAPHYVDPQIRYCTAQSAMIVSSAADDAIATSQLLLGEAFALLDITGDMAWGYSLHDDYCGYVPLSVLGAADTGADFAPTHVVNVRSALVFLGSSIKSKVQAAIPMGAKFVANGESECGQYLTCDAGFLSKKQAMLIGEKTLDPVDTAAQLIGAPYVWGGRTGTGLDCSGLVQLVLGLAGVNAPRDSDQQMQALGEPLKDGETLRRGDLIFFPGHVGIMADSKNLTHANAHWMQVVTEPLDDVVARFPDDVETPVLARKRIN